MLLNVQVLHSNKNYVEWHRHLFPDLTSIISPNFCSLRRFLSFHAITTLVHAMICTSVIFGRAAYIGLQSILNVASLIIGGIPKFTHISGFIMDQLH